MLLTERELCPSIRDPEVPEVPPFANNPWRVINVRPRHEQVVARQLEGRCELYLPTYRSVRKWHDRKMTLDLPLFPGYVFVRINASERARILKTSGVRSLLAFGNEPAQVKESEIDEIKRIVASGCAVSPSALILGNRVRVIDGPMQGVEGVLQEFKNTCYLVVVVQMVSRAVKVTIERDWVKGIR